MLTTNFLHKFSHQERSIIHRPNVRKHKTENGFIWNDDGGEKNMTNREAATTSMMT